LLAGQIVPVERGRVGRPVAIIRTVDQEFWHLQPVAIVPGVDQPHETPAPPGLDRLLDSQASVRLDLLAVPAPEGQLMRHLRFQVEAIEYDGNDRLYAR